MTNDSNPSGAVKVAAPTWLPEMTGLVAKLRNGDWSLRSPDELACMIADMLERAIPRLAATPQATGALSDIIFRSRVADLLHLLAFATISTPTPTDAHQAQFIAEELRTKLATQEASPQALEVSEEAWRPIATAPQHGTILLWWKNAGAVTGGFVIDEEWTPGSKTPREGWAGDGDEGIPRNQEDCTHWQLLRAPDGCKWPRFSDGHSTQEWFEEHYAALSPAKRVAEPVVQWISVDERLPEKFEQLWVANFDGVQRAIWSDTDRDFLVEDVHGAYEKAFGVTHWMLFVVPDRPGISATTTPGAGVEHG